METESKHELETGAALELRYESLDGFRYFLDGIGIYTGDLAGDISGR